MKICDKEMTKDQAILTAEGSIMMMKAASMFAAPTWVQDKALKAGTGRSNLMVRYGGASLGAVGMHVVAAGYCDDVKVQRRAAKIVAGHSALVAGMAAAHLSGVETEQVIDKNKLIAVVALSAANSALMAWRGFKKDD